MKLKKYRDKAFRSIHIKFTVNAMILISIILLVLIVLFNTYIYISNIRGAKAFSVSVLYGKNNISALNGGIKTPIDLLWERIDFYTYKKMHHALPPEYILDFSECNEMPPPPIITKRPGSFRDYSIVRLDAEGNILHSVCYFNNKEDYKLTEKELVSEAFLHKDTKNFFHKYNEYLFTYKQEYFGDLVVLIIDYSPEINLQTHFTYASLFIFVCAVLFSFLVTWFSASFMIKPIHDSIIKQKQFIADTSHELKTPIAVIEANVAVLENEIPGNKWLSYIKTENSRMGSLVKNMLYLAKTDSGRMTYEMLPFDFVECCKNAVMPFESVAKEQNKKLEIKCPNSMIPVVGDQAKITQLIIILVDNAIKNSFENALIRLTCGIEENRPFISVYNTGRGISEADRKKIFDRFYRADSSRDRVTGGYGLGLAIAKTISDAHKGRITVNSKEGEWAEFVFSFPSNFYKK